MRDIYENKEEEKNRISEGNGNNIEKYLPLLEKIVKEFENSGENKEVLKQVGYIGLINAINLFQNRKEISFDDYARNLIAGEIRHYIREKYKKVKIPGWINMINHFIDNILIAYKHKYKKFPSFTELSDILNISPEGLKEALKAREPVHKVSIGQKRRDLDIKELPDISKIKKEMIRRENE